jgi:hypothetical protein
MNVLQVKTVSDTSCFRSKFKTIYNSIVICAHFNKIYIWAFSEQVLLKITKTGFYFKKTVPGGVSWPSLGPTGKLFLARGKKKFGKPCSKS